MENPGGLSNDLKQKVSATKVAVIGECDDKLMEQAIRRLGFIDIVATSDLCNLPISDIVICTCTEKEVYRGVIAHYNDVRVPVICAFNFGIGACVTVVVPGNGLPHFIGKKADNDTVRSMLEYTSGYSKFWHIPRNSWVDEAMKYICTPEVKASIGEYTMIAMVAHLLIAVVAGNKVKTYPKFYLSTIANDIY